MGLRMNHCPPIFTRLLSHATRFAILGSPVPLRPLILGKRVDYVSVGQTVAKYFVNPVDCEAGGEGGKGSHGRATPEPAGGRLHPPYSTAAGIHQFTEIRTRCRLIESKLFVY